MLEGELCVEVVEGEEGEKEGGGRWRSQACVLASREKGRARGERRVPCGELRVEVAEEEWVEEEEEEEEEEEGEEEGVGELADVAAEGGLE